MNHQIIPRNVSIRNENVRLLSRREVSRHIDCLIETLPEFPVKEEILESYHWLNALVKGEVADIIDFDDVRQIEHHFLWDAADLGYLKYGLRTAWNDKKEAEASMYLSMLSDLKSDRMGAPLGE